MTPGILATATYGRVDAPPLLFIRALPAEVDNPRGVDRIMERLILRGPAGVSRVHAVGRPAYLPTDFDMPEIADIYARYLREHFDRPVALMGLSTGASVALQLAADHPALVKSLVVAAGSGRLSARGRAIQRRYVSLLTAADRRAYAELASATMNSKHFDGVVRLASRIAPKPDDPESLIALVRAEDRYDMLGRAHRITAPTLILSGERDVFYPPTLGRETAERIRRASQIVYRGRAHGGVPLHPHFARDIAGFLSAHA